MPAVVIKLTILRWGDYPGLLLRALNVITNLYKRVTGGMTVRVGTVTMKEAEIGVTHSEDGGDKSQGSTESE